MTGSLSSIYTLSQRTHLRAGLDIGPSRHALAIGIEPAIFFCPLRLRYTGLHMIEGLLRIIRLPGSNSAWHLAMSYST